MIEKREIPGTGIRISALSLGGWLTLGGSVDQRSSAAILRAAIDAGINFIDLADVYADGEAERVVGRALGSALDTVVISSKVFWPTSEDPRDRGLGRAHVHRSIDRTLQRLGRDRVDLYFCHREDPDTPLLETVQAMHDLVRAGKVRVWGTSCWRPQTLRAAHALAREHRLEPPRIEQPQFSLLARWPEKDVIPCCRELGMAVVAFSPLAGGVLTGKYNQGMPSGSRGATTRWLEDVLRPDVMARVRRFCALCQQHEVAPAVAALAWVMQRPGVTSAISGASTLDQLHNNLAAAQWRMPDGFGDALDDIFPRPGRPWLRRLGRWLFGRG